MASVVEAPAYVDEVDRARDSNPSDRFPTALVAIAAGVSIALRARFLVTPLTSDEGGYLAVARAWASGKTLYGQAWVDRPQGLLVLFRVWDALTGGSPAAIRAMAILFGVVAVFAVAYVAFAIAGPRAAAAAGLMVAVASSNARIEGFIANGELLAGTLGAAGVAASCVYLFRARRLRWLFVGGVLFACAVSLKQSGFDGFLAVLVCIVAGGFTRERTWRQVGREAGVCLAGFASVLGLLVVHGVIVGFRAWWYAVAGYRLSGPNASDANWHRFGVTVRLARPALLPLLIVGIVGVVLWLARDRQLRRATFLIPAWLVFASAAVVAGGLFHRHYWVTLTFPLAAAGGVAVAKMKAPLAIALTCLAVVPSLVGTAKVIALDRTDVAITAHDDPRLRVDEAISRWYTSNRTADSTFYVMCASAAVYAEADVIPPYPYLWLDGVQHGRGAQQQLESFLAGPSAPTFVALYQSVFTCNPSGVVNSLLRQRYDNIANVDGAVIFRLREPSSSTSVFGSNEPATRA
ncbi:MAG TPA: hypothetical protein VFE86_06530 [Ilumatobacteraceae bacterium]|nr:hypothetical protein [Ilumatobacteraceae bacterium]